MAAVKSLRGVLLAVKIGNGAGPEAFTTRCSINAARGIVFDAQMNEQNIPDCDDPDLMAWVAREKVSLSSTINGAGMCDTRDVPFFAAWFESANPKNVQVHLGSVVLADGGGHWAGAYHLGNFQVTGERGARTEFSCTLSSDGAVPYVAADA